MAGIQTSRITTDSGDDLTIQPAAGKKTLLKSVTSDNPGATPLVTKSDGEVQKLDISQLEDIGGLAADDDWLMIHDVSDSNKIKKISAAEVLGGGGLSTSPQPNFPDPLPSNGLWVDVDSVLAVQAGGSGSTADLQNSVEFAVADNTYNQSDKNVALGQSVFVRWMQSKLDSATHGQVVSGTLYAKSGSSFTQTWNLTIVKQPTGGWNLVDLVDQPVSTQVTSALVTPTGMNAPSPVTIDGGTLTSIEVSVNGGAFTSSPGKIEGGQTIAVRGTTGASNSTGYTALVSIGGSQQTWTVTTGAPVASISQPSITTPIDGTGDLSPDVKLWSTDYVALNGAGAHVGPSEWEVYEANQGTAAPSSDPPGAGYTSITPSDTKKVQATLDKTNLTESKVYYSRVRYTDGSVTSPWSAWHSFETADSFGPPPPGTEMEGGYFVSVVQYVGAEEQAGIGNKYYYLIWSPKDDGEIIGQVSTADETIPPSSDIKTALYVRNDPDSLELRSNGEQLTLKMSQENRWWMAKEAKRRAASGIGGQTDWYLPSLQELMTCVYKFNPRVHNTQGSRGPMGPPKIARFPDEIPSNATHPPQVEDPRFQSNGGEGWTTGDDPDSISLKIRSDYTGHKEMRIWSIDIETMQEQSGRGVQLTHVIRMVRITEATPYN